MSNWPSKIENLYKNWINNSPTFINDLQDEIRFFKFVWACVYDPENAPTSHEFNKRFESDMYNIIDNDKRETLVREVTDFFITLLDFAKER